MIKKPGNRKSKIKQPSRKARQDKLSIEQLLASQPGITELTKLSAYATQQQAQYYHYTARQHMVEANAASSLS